MLYVTIIKIRLFYLHFHCYYFVINTILIYLLLLSLILFIYLLIIRGDHVDEAFVEVAQKIYQKIQDGRCVRAINCSN
jgi:hypothetical protein